MKKLAVVFLGITILSCSEKQRKDDPSFESLDYKLYSSDKEAGYFKSWREEAGTYHYEIEYNDRGRGPHLNELITLGEDGLVKALRISGHNYLKDTVNEIFQISDNRAKWESTVENGESEAKNAHYSGVNSSYGNLEIVLRHLLLADKKSIDLYPSGRVKLASVHDFTLGDTLHLKLVEYTGFSFTPGYMWFDENNRFFASPSTWFTCVRSGYEQLTSELLEIQTNAEKEYYKTLTKTLTQKPSGKVLFRNANVFDSKNAVINKNKHVLIHGNKIESILDGDEPAPDAELVIDATSKTLMPSLFDMHGHLSRGQGLMNLAAGVTSVRDLGNALDLPSIKADFDNDSIMGPRILVMSGFIDKSGPYAGPIGKIIGSLEEGFAAINYYHENGYKQIKLYSSIEPEWVEPLADKAHELGMRVSGHIPAYMLAEDAVRSGYDEIQHANMLALNFMSDTIDTRTPLRFSMIGEHAHAIDLKGAEFKAFLQLLKENNVVSDPTVSIFEGMLTSKAGEPSPMFKSILDRLPIQVKRNYYSGGLPIPEGKERQYKDSFQKLLDIVKALYDAGVTIVPGTDAMAGFALHTELENYVRAGIPAEQVLKIATYTAAQVVGASELGVIEEGKLADIVIIDGNPMEDISQIRRVELTMKDGNIYNPKELYEAIGVAHYK